MHCREVLAVHHDVRCPAYLTNVGGDVVAQHALRPDSTVDEA